MKNSYMNAYFSNYKQTLVNLILNKFVHRFYCGNGIKYNLNLQTINKANEKIIYLLFLTKIHMQLQRNQTQRFFKK